MNSPFNEIRFSTYHEVIADELRLSIRRYNDAWEEVLWNGWQKSEYYASWIERRRFPVIVWTWTLLENLANFYISTKCDAEVFSELQKSELKWIAVPKLFTPTYSCPADIVTDLNRLATRRNAVIHGKPLVSIDGDNRQAGNEPAITVDEHEFMTAIATLPRRLIDNLLQHDPSFHLLSGFRVLCGQVAQEFHTGEVRQKSLFKHPRALIEELMEQGFDRSKAIECAILLGEKPKLDETGNYTIHLGGKKVQVKPLKFFGHKAA